MRFESVIHSHSCSFDFSGIPGSLPRDNILRQSMFGYLMVIERLFRCKAFRAEKTPVNVRRFVLISQNFEKIIAFVEMDSAFSTLEGHSCFASILLMFGSEMIIQEPLSFENLATSLT